MCHPLNQCKASTLHFRKCAVSTPSCIMVLLGINTMSIACLRLLPRRWPIRKFAHTCHFILKTVGQSCLKHVKVTDGSKSYPTPKRHPCYESHNRTTIFTSLPCSETESAASPLDGLPKMVSSFAKCWALRPVSTAELDGWRVLAKSEPYVVPATDFLKNFPEFRRDVESKFYDLPNPANIIDVYDETTSTTTQWTHTDPQVGNPWRAKADGCRVVTFPLWMYCDDTSGNVSKKWNEHNSFLVTPAGLPREESQKEYNIHFLCTSNIAPPLEMLDGIVDQLDEAQKHGVWAWDCELNEPVLLVPEVLALLGDNPMQRMDALDTDPEPGGNGDDGSVADDDRSSVGGSDRSDASEDSAGSKKGKKRKKVKETLGQMIQRVKNFVKIGRLRNKTETTNKLKSYFTEASTVDTKTKVQDQRTESGVKDTYQLFFLEKLFESYKGKRGRATKQAALDAQLAQLPTNTTSPVWRIKGLDPHQDTPVEILHVVLLGFVKYFWRDLIQLQLKNKDDKKELLITREKTKQKYVTVKISPLVPVLMPPQIRDSIDPATFIQLDKFVYSLATKFKLGGVDGELSDLYTIHAVLLRRFAFDHPELLWTDEAEGDEDSESPSKKRKATAKQGGRVAAGQDFWSKVDAYFKKEIEKRGRSFKDARWKPYIDQIIVDDNSKFFGMKPGLPVSVVNDPVASEASASSISQFGSLSGPDLGLALVNVNSFGAGNVGSWGSGFNSASGI
ncbi:hypothetical protein MSAN_00270000 [Mycena sanguinolenta]|uniref:Uncharacterized protein n=1 Tax=Mycena sanguinolenta TaxID=230812 RepID=A0A8H7DM04_9AGAR|nr:hypothetical protein MSAN_00270000 [Mycena sanguinolenta]